MLDHLHFQMRDVVVMLRDAWHVESAERLEREAGGRNVLEGGGPSRSSRSSRTSTTTRSAPWEKQVRDEPVGRQRHVFEAEMKEARRTSGMPSHEARAPAAHVRRVVTEQRHT